MDGERTVAAIMSGDQLPRIYFFRSWKRPLFVAGGEPHLLRYNPNLKEMVGRFLTWIIFTVTDARAGSHALNFAVLDVSHISKSILVRQCSGQQIGNDFHILMGVFQEAPTGCDPVLIDNTENAGPPDVRGRGGAK